MTSEQPSSNLPDLPPCPTDHEMIEFSVMCGQVMRGQPTTPIVAALKASLSMIFALRAEIERLREQLGEETVTDDRAAQLNAKFLEGLREGL